MSLNGRYRGKFCAMHSRHTSPIMLQVVIVAFMIINLILHNFLGPVYLCTYTAP